MKSRQLLPVLLILSVAVLFSVSFVAGAQATTGPALVAQALRDTGTNCANLALNTTCIGFASVQRTTSSGIVSTTYSQPGDRASINTTHRIQTTALSTATGVYGINVIKAQAGLPASSGGVVYFAFGGTTLTNIGGTGQAVWQNIGVTMAPGTEAGATNLFLIQGPKTAPATVTVNNVKMELHSTVAAEFHADGSVCFLVISGSAIFFPGTPQQVIANVGYKTCGTAAGLSAPVMFTPGDVANAQILASIPPNVLDYPINVPVIVCPSGVGQANCTVSSS